jgi:hypothetical protein
MKPENLTRACAVLLLLGAVGCGPEYTAVYDYVQPASAAGIGCTNQCTATENQCKQSVDVQYQVSLTAAGITYQSCLTQKLTAPKTICIDTRAFTTHPGYGRCTEEYNGCFQQCGGEVRARVLPQ